MGAERQAVSRLIKNVFCSLTISFSTTEQTLKSSQTMIDYNETIMCAENRHTVHFPVRKLDVQLSCRVEFHYERAIVILFTREPNSRA